MGPADHGSIPPPDPGTRRVQGEIAADAPPQRQPGDLARSEDLGGVVDPHDADLVDAGGWSSWSTGERLTVLAGFLIVLAVVAVIIVTLVA